LTDLLMLTRLEEALARGGCPVCHEATQAPEEERDEWPSI
jgi:hypothetical protein